VLPPGAYRNLHDADEVIEPPLYPRTPAGRFGAHPAGVPRASSAHLQNKRSKCTDTHIVLNITIRSHAAHPRPRPAGTCRDAPACASRKSRPRATRRILASTQSWTRGMRRMGWGLLKTWVWVLVGVLVGTTPSSTSVCEKRLLLSFPLEITPNLDKGDSRPRTAQALSPHCEAVAVRVLRVSCDPRTATLGRLAWCRAAEMA